MASSPTSSEQGADSPGAGDLAETVLIEIPQALIGQRLDKALVELMPTYTRAMLQGWLRDGHILVDGRNAKSSDKVRSRQRLSVTIPQTRSEDWIAQEMELDIVFEDEQLLVINKRAGLVVHPGAGNPDNTLLNGLLFLHPALHKLPRAGIVHRLDKDTTGLMVVAKTEMARQSLIEQLKDHSVSRRYLAVTSGLPISGETIDQPIGRHRVDRLRMAVTDRGKPAVTHTRVVEKFSNHALVEANLETGRTHQIRVHLAWRGFPLVGDPLYGGKLRLPAAASDALIEALRDFKRQALHAEGLSLTHPEHGETMRWQHDMPRDMTSLLDRLRADRRQRLS